MVQQPVISDRRLDALRRQAEIAILIKYQDETDALYERLVKDAEAEIH